MFREEFTEVGDRVIYDSFYGLLVDYVEKMQASIVIRGLRAASDFEYEFQMALMNRHMKPNIDTVFLATGAAHFLYRLAPGQGNRQLRRIGPGPGPGPHRAASTEKLAATS